MNSLSPQEEDYPAEMGALINQNSNIDAQSRGTLMSTWPNEVYFPIDNLE